MTAENIIIIITTYLYGINSHEAWKSCKIYMHIFTGLVTVVVLISKSNITINAATNNNHIYTVKTSLKEQMQCL